MGAFLVNYNHVSNGLLGRLLCLLAHTTYSFHRLCSDPLCCALLRSLRLLSPFLGSRTYFAHSLMVWLKFIFMLLPRFTWMITFVVFTINTPQFVQLMTTTWCICYSLPSCWLPSGLRFLLPLVLTRIPKCKFFISGCIMQLVWVIYFLLGLTKISVDTFNYFRHLVRYIQHWFPKIHWIVFWRFQDFKISRFQDFKISRFKDFQKCIFFFFFNHPFINSFV